MIKFLATNLISMLFFSNLCFADIIKTGDISAIESSLGNLDTQSLVIFDVADVLMTSGDHILKSRNKEDKVILRKKLEQSVSPGEAEILLSIILKQRKNSVVDPKMPQLIARLQSRGIRVLGLTNCFTGKFGKIPSRETWRINELKKHGYHFIKSWGGLKTQGFADMSVSGQESIPLFKEGIVFTSRASKGEILEEFLDYAKFKPTKIVFIDNKIKHLESVQKYAKNHNIEFTGIEYTAVADAKVEPLNKTCAELQFEILIREKRWISDAEADELMQKGYKIR